MLLKTEIETIFTSYRIHLTVEQLDDFYKYYQLIENTNKVMNLTGFTENRLVIEGLIESFLVLDKAFVLSKDATKKYKLVDIGAGVGFPSIPFLIMNKNIVDLTIIEPLKKRCVFLEKVSEELNLDIKILNSRAEDVKMTEKFDLVTARAVTELKNLIEISCQLGKVNSQQVFIKGNNIDQEILNSKNIVQTLDLKISVENYNTMNIRDNSLVRVHKEHSISKKYPRSWAQIIKNC